MILEYKEYFITKTSKVTFAGYANSQIKKARGLNKMINWEHDKVARKSVLDFCYILSKDGKTIKFKSWIKQFNTRYESFLFENYDGKPLTQKSLGLSKLNNARDMYGVYIVLKEKEWDGESYYGGIYNDENSNDVKLTSFSKDAPFIEYLVFNKDSYSTHCKDYASYQTWIKKRNPVRFNTNQEHGKGFDSKNMSHCIRLLEMATEIATTGELNVRRTGESLQRLIKIKKGVYEYDQLISDADQMTANLDELFEKSKIPDKVDPELVSNLELKIRKLFYNLN